MAGGEKICLVFFFVNGSGCLRYPREEYEVSSLRAGGSISFPIVTESRESGILPTIYQKDSISGCG